MSVSLDSRTNSSGVSNMFDSSDNEVISFGIDTSAISHIMERLTELYGDPVAASIRETISNAIDAMKAFSIKSGAAFQPIQVTTPSSVSPFFTVTDNGTGMSFETIKSVYTKYGTTTKAGDANATGAFGFGAKAPMAYTNEYEVITTHEGVTMRFSIYRNADGPKLEVISKEQTGAESGTTVRIPVREHDFYKFEDVVDSYKRFAFSAPIVINGTLYDSNDNYTFVDNIVIDSETGETARVWFDNSRINDIINSALNYSPIVPTAILNGYGYLFPSRGAYSNNYVIVEIKPNTLDFSSSRDDITVNSRSDAFIAAYNRQMGNNSDIILRAMFKFLRTLSQEKVVEISSSSKIRLGFEDGQIVTPYTDTKWDKSELVLDDGTDIISQFETFGGKPVLAAYRVKSGASASASATIGMHYMEMNGIFPTFKSVNYTKVTAFQDDLEDIINLPDTDRHSLTEWAYIGCKNIYSDRSLNRVFVISVKNAADAKKVVRKRNAAVNTISSHNVILVDSSYTISEDEKSNFESFFAADAVKYQTVEEYCDASDAGKIVVDKTATEIAEIRSIFADGISSREELIKATVSYRPFKEESISDFVALNALFIPVSAYGVDDTLPVINGYLQTHGEDSLKGRPIVAILRPKKAHFDTMGADNVMFSARYSHIAKSVIAMQEGRSYYRRLDSDVAKYASNESLIRNFIHRNCSEFSAIFSTIKKHVENNVEVPAFKRFVDFYETYWNVKADSTLVPSGQDLMKRIGKDAFREIAESVAVSNGAYQSSYNMNELGHAFALLKKNEMPSYLKESIVRYANETLDTDADDQVERMLLR